jgi:hypothetical protein
MSQMLVRKGGPRLYQDLIFSDKKVCVGTLASQASCYICGKGLEDGYSLTARYFATGILLFCNKHNLD